MKDWWLSLTQREHLLVSTAGFFTTLILIYFFIWFPLSNKVTQLHNDVRQNIALANWLKHNVANVQSLEKKQARENHLASAGTLLTITDQTLQETGLKNFVSDFTENNENTVIIKFQQVPFDYLIKMLTLLWQAHGIKASSLTVIPLEKSGLVKASLRLHEL